MHYKDWKNKNTFGTVHEYLAYCSKVSGLAPNFSGADLRGTALAGLDLSYADMTDVNLCMVNMRRTNLYRANLTRANVVSASLTDSNLEYAVLADADMVRAGLSGANLARAILERTNLLFADLAHANMQGAYLKDTILTHADMQGANIEGVSGLPTVQDFMEQFLRFDGYYVYKLVHKDGKRGVRFPLPKTWKLKLGAVWQSDVDTDRRNDCSYGINFGTWEWCKVNKRWNDIIHVLYIPPSHLNDVVVPYATDGKGRCGYAEYRCATNGQD